MNKFIRWTACFTALFIVACLLPGCVGVFRVGTKPQPYERIDVNGYVSGEIPTAGATKPGCDVFILPSQKPLPSDPVFSDEEFDDMEAVARKLALYGTKLKKIAQDERAALLTAHQEHLRSCRR